MQELNEFIEVCSGYIGKLDVSTNSATFTANNEICCYYENGTIHTKKKVECILQLEYKFGKLIFSGHEKTYEIIGGFSSDYSKERLLYELKRYNFVENKQYSIFDL